MDPNDRPESTEDQTLDERVAAHFDDVFGGTDSADGGGDSDPGAEDDSTTGGDTTDDAPEGDGEDAAPTPEDESVGGDGDSADPPAGTTAPAPPADDFIDIAGQQFLRRDVEGLVAWASTLSDDDFAKVQAVLNGYPTPAPAQTQTPPAEEDAPAFNPDDAVDPDLARYVDQRLAEQQAEIERLRGIAAAQSQVEYQREEARLAAAYQEARTGVADRLGLSDADLEALAVRTGESGIVTYLSQTKGLGNPKAMFEEALETVYWMTPEFRERTVETRVSEATEEVSRVEAKKRKAAAASGSTSSASRSKAEPQTADERYAAMVGEISQAMSR